MALFDSIVSTPGVLLPWREMVQICKDEHVWSVVDAAHSIGQELHLNLTEAGPDFWVSVCRLWLCYVPLRSHTVSTELLQMALRKAGLRGSVRSQEVRTHHTPDVLANRVPYRRNHHVIKTSLPTSVNYLDFKRSGRANLLTTFLCTYDDIIHHLQCCNDGNDAFTGSGSIDYVVPLSIKPALDFRASIGGEEKINEYCHRLALAGGKRLAEILDTQMMYSSDEEECYVANMVGLRIHQCVAMMAYMVTKG